MERMEKECRRRRAKKKERQKEVNRLTSINKTSWYSPREYVPVYPDTMHIQMENHPHESDGLADHMVQHENTKLIIIFQTNESFNLKKSK